MDAYRGPDGWWLETEGHWRTGLGGSSLAEGTTRGPFPARPVPVARRGWSGYAPDGDTWSIEVVAWDAGLVARVVSVREVAAHRGTAEDDVERWLGDDEPGPEILGPFACPPGDPGDLGDAGDRFFWDDGRGWMAGIRRQTDALGNPGGDGPGHRRAARELVARAPELATPGALMAAGYLSPREADLAAPWLEDAWARALDPAAATGGDEF